MIAEETRPLYESDPEAYQRYLAEGNAKQARKRVSADVLVRDGAGRILLVDPGYKPDWDVPGGMVEANESPHLGARRELREELGLDLHISRPLVIDWVSPHGVWDDLTAFVFDGGTVTDAQVAALVLLDGELNAFEFCTVEQARERLRPYVWARMAAALEAASLGTVQYLQDGQAVI